MSIAGTRQLIRRWGKSGRGSILGFPTMVAFMRITFGTADSPGEVDADVERIDTIVSNAPTEFKNVLITHYCRGASTRYLAKLLGCSKSHVWTLIDEAVWYVHTELDPADEKGHKASTSPSRLRNSPCVNRTKA